MFVRFWLLHRCVCLECKLGLWAVCRGVGQCWGSFSSESVGVSRPVSTALWQIERVRSVAGLVSDRNCCEKKNTTAVRGEVSVLLSVILSVILSVLLAVLLSVLLSVLLAVLLSVLLSVILSVLLSVILSVLLSVILSVLLTLRHISAWKTASVTGKLL